MSKNILLTIVTLLLFVIIIFTIVKFLNNGSRSIPQPSASFYNLPKEIKYDSSTDLKQELETVNPQVSDSDFSGL